MIPDVTVITPAYNSVSFIERCVDSVRNQSIGEDRLEYIVVDDCSTDGTAQELDRLADEWPSMRVIHLEENSGSPSRPRNVALDIAQGRYVFMLDADDYLGVEALERMVAAADENETDVVLGRFVSVGGRAIPRSMFTHNQPNTNVFDSRVYWTFNPMKLYRRALIERLGLRYREDLVFGEDQPFTATLYLNAAGITVIADYDCVYWTQRPDMQNMCSLVTLQGKLDCLDVMMPLVVEAVPSGPNRDHLLQRHFEFAIRDAARALALDPDPDARSAAWAKVKAWTDELYHDGIGAKLSPIHRVVYGLIARDRLDKLVEFFERRQSDEAIRPVVENGRVFAGLPFFRDPELDLPDEYYDLTSRVSVHRSLESMTWDGGTLTLAGFTHLVDVETTGLTVDVQLTERRSGRELIFPASVDPSTTHPSETQDDTLRPAQYRCAIDLASAMDGRPLSRGIWDVRLRLEIDGVVKVVRLGSTRAIDIDTSSIPRVVVGRDDRTSIVSTYFTTGYDNLSLDVGEVWTPVEFQVGSGAWDAQQPATITVAGRVTALGLPAGTVKLLLDDGAGTTHEIDADLSEGTVETDFVARIRLREAATGRPLAYGTWTVTARLVCGDLLRSSPVPVGDPLATIRWWRGARPSHTRSLPDELETLTLRVTPVRFKHAVRRRLRAVLARFGFGR